MNITLRQLIKIFEQFASDHPQINSFGHGDVWEITANKLEHPTLWVDIQPSTINRNTVLYNFTIYCMDLVNKSENNELDVHNDIFMILRDLIIILKRDYELINENASIPITPFTENFDDEVSGWFITLPIEAEVTYGECDIPGQFSIYNIGQNPPFNLFDTTVKWVNITEKPEGLVSGSSQLTGSYDTRYILSGSITAADWNTLLNRPENILSSSAQIASDISGAFTQTSQSISGDINTITNRLNSLETESGSIRTDFNQFTGSQNNLNQTFATTGSNIFNGTQTINGDLNINGNLTAKDFYINSASVIYTSGSTKFGDTLDDTHQFTGSVSITGSISLNGQPIGTGKLDEIIFNNFTQSYNLYTQSIEIEQNIQNDRLISLEFESASIINNFNLYTSSTNDKINELQNFSSSLNTTFATNAELLQTASYLESIIDTKLNTGSFNEYTASNDILNTTQTNRLDLLSTFSGSANSRLDNIESFTSSIDTTIKTKLDIEGVISGSDQLTGSYDSRYEKQGSGILSGSVLNYIPVIVSQSSQIQINDVTGFNTYSQSVDSRLDSLELESGSIRTELNSYTQSTNNRINDLELFSSSLDLTFATDAELQSLQTLLENNINTRLLTSSFNNYTESINNHISSLEIESSSIRSNFNSYTSSVNNKLENLEIYTASNDTTNTTQNNRLDLLSTFSGSTIDRLNNIENVTSSFVTSDITGSSIVTASVNVNFITFTKGDDSTFTLEVLASGSVIPGIISGSDQLTASLDLRYAFSGSGGTLPSGLISGSSQLTSSYDARYELQGRNIISSSTQIANDISSSFLSISQSISTDINNLDDRLDNLESFSSSLSSIYVTDSELSQTASFLESKIDIKLNTASFNDYTESINNKIISLEIESGSIRTTLNSYTQSNDLRVQSLEVESGSVRGRLNNIENFTSSQNNLNQTFATTGSNSFIGNQTITGNLNVTNQFTASGFNYPTTDGVFGIEVLTTNGNGDLTLEIPETLYEEVKNDDIVTLLKGTPVKVTGYQGNQALVVKADASNPSLMPATYILANNLDPQDEGLGIILGRINGINTAGLTAGEIVYVAPGGGFTQTRPTGTNLVQPLGIPVNIGANGSGVVLNSGVTNDLPNLTLGSLWVGGSGSVATTITTSSFAKVGQNNTFTGLQTFNNIQVNGTASFTYIQSVTGSAKIIGDAFIILNNNLPAEPYAGIKVIDSGSTNVTASLLWDGANNHWIYENVSGSSYGAAGFIAGPRSTDINNILYPTQYKVLRSQGGDHLYDSNITDNDTNVSIIIPLSVTTDITSSGIIKATGGFEGNITGNASTATTASYVEYSNVGNKPTLLSSSAQIASDISGAFGATSASISIDINTLDLRLNSLETESGSIRASFNLYTSSNDTTNTTQNGRLDQLSIFSGSTNNRLNSIENTTSSINNSINNINTFTSSANLRLNSLETESGSIRSTLNSYTGSANNRLNNIELFTSSIDTTIKTKLNVEGVISGSSQVSYTGLSNIPLGIISGSSQLTSSFDIRYALSGSSTVLPAGLVSGSSQLTASYDTRYELQGRSILSGSVLNYIPVIVSGSSQVSMGGDLTGTANNAQIAAGAIVNADVNASAAIEYTKLNFNGSGFVSGSNQINNSTLSGMTVSGSFSGSFKGDGSQLTNISVDEYQIIVLTHLFS